MTKCVVCTPFWRIVIKQKAVTRQPEFLPTADNRFCLPIGNMAGKYRHLVFSEPFLSHQTLIFTLFSRYIFIIWQIIFIFFVFFIWDDGWRHYGSILQVQVGRNIPDLLYLTPSSRNLLLSPQISCGSGFSPDP